jgi:hypothetical protein
MALPQGRRAFLVFATRFAFSLEKRLNYSRRLWPPRIMEIEHGYWRWKIFRWDRHPNPFRGRPDLAINWLRRFERDGRVMSELRQLLADSRDNTLRRPTDRQVIEDVARRLSSGELLVCAESSHPFHLDVTEVKVAAPLPASKEALDELMQSPPPKAPAPPPPAPAPAPIEPTLPPNADETRIADALKEAAQKGTPFCEECQKAPAAARSLSLPLPVPAAAAGSAGSAERSAEAQGVMRSSASPPPAAEEGSLPSDADPAALARGMRQAAAEGQPFCEESARAT